MPGLHGHVSPCADRDADIRRCQGRRVVHSVADHRDFPAPLLQLFHLRGLVLRQNLREYRVDAEVLGDGAGHGTRVSREHRNVDAALMERGDRLAALGANRISHREYRNSGAALQQVDRRLRTLCGRITPLPHGRNISIDERLRTWQRVEN